MEIKELFIKKETPKKEKYNSVKEEIEALNIQIKERLDDFLNKQRVEKIEESYKIARTEIVIDEIIKESKEKIKKIPIFKAKLLKRLENKIDYLDKEKWILIKKREKLKEEQDILKLATKI
jgi:hypothetical protein